MNRKVKIGDKVLYFPRSEESKRCNFAKIMGATVVRIDDEKSDVIGVKYVCDHGVDKTVNLIPKRFKEGETGVWDWPEKDHVKSSKIIS